MSFNCPSCKKSVPWHIQTSLGICKICELEVMIKMKNTPPPAADIKIHADPGAMCARCGLLYRAEDMRGDFCYYCPPSEGTKHDSDKIRMELLPAYSLEQIAKVLTFGARKYDSWNWTKGFDFSRLQGATQRHLAAWSKGEDTDPESGISHLAHAGCCILFLLWMERHRPDLDDRFKDPVLNEVNKERSE